MSATGLASNARAAAPELRAHPQVEQIIAVARAECAEAGLPIDDTTVMRRLAAMLAVTMPATSGGFLRVAQPGGRAPKPAPKVACEL